MSCPAFAAPALPEQTIKVHCADSLSRVGNTMTNNDILRRIRYAFDFGDAKMISLFALALHPVTREQISAWLKKDDDPAFQECSGTELASFLNGLIIDRRGRKDGPQPEPEKHLNNNIIFRKLKIALNLKDDDIIEILTLARLRLSKPELSAFFRNPAHRHYRVCKDQVLRNFLIGIQIKYRADKQAKRAGKPEMPKESN
jgi:uncharacterized protein YehS (DUF1456 family)